ncbi:MAG: hypothetical protein ACJ754_03625 [Pyrinomonadaceae bacterium]
MAQKTGDCYIDVWREADFRGETMRIRGPAEYGSLDFARESWCDDIGSLRVGPNAFVMAYRRRDFQDEPVTFGPNDEVADLSQFEFDDEIESMKVIDSLKIFDHLDYNAALTPAAPDADVQGGDEAQPNPDKGKPRKGRKR